MAYQHERTTARRCAAQILYTGEIRNASAIELLDSGALTCFDGEISDYAYSLVEGVEDHLSEIDSHIGESSVNWAIDRMPLMDLAILRIALYEMLYVDAVPISVSINEAVELAKVFGGEDGSPAFVNGMLGSIARQMGEGADLDESPDADGSACDKADPDQAASENDKAPSDQDGPSLDDLDSTEGEVGSDER